MVHCPVPANFIRYVIAESSQSGHPIQSLVADFGRCGAAIHRRFRLDSLV
jgi:hypothetical protein